MSGRSPVRYVIAIAVFSVPIFVHADTPFLTPLYVDDTGYSTPPISTIGHQSALSAGDATTFRAYVHSWQGIPSVSIDASSIGVPSPTTTPVVTTDAQHYFLNGVDYFPNYFFDFGPFTIDPSVEDGLKTVSVTATDSSNNVATATTQILIDSTPPTLLLKKISFSATPPH